MEALRDGHLLQEEATPALLKGVAQEERMHAKCDEARRQTWRRRQEQLGQLDRLLDWSKLLGATAWVQTTSGRARAQALEHIASRGMRVTQDCSKHMIIVAAHNGLPHFRAFWWDTVVQWELA